MMGHICTMLMGMVERDHGSEGMDRIFEISSVEPQQFHAELVYPEEMFQSLLAAALEVYGVDGDTAQLAFSEYFMDRSPKLFPAIFNKAKNAREMLEMVPVIHKQWPSAVSAPDFREKLWIESSAEERLVFKYQSPNRLCGVLCRVAELVLAHYSETGEVKELECMKDGAEFCRVQIGFTHETT